MTAARAVAAHAVAVMLVRGNERIRCTCGADIPFDRAADVIAATDKAVRQHLADAAPDLVSDLVSGCPSGDCDCCGWRFLRDGETGGRHD